MAMKYEHLTVGESYQTKIGGDWQLVVLQNKREELNAGKSSREVQVIVRTGAGNLIYRTPGQLRRP